MAKEEKPVVVEAIGAASQGGVNSQAIEEAMAQAGLKAMEEGITDPEKIRARKLAARDEIKAKAAAK